MDSSLSTTILGLAAFIIVGLFMLGDNDPNRGWGECAPDPADVCAACGRK